MLQGTFDQQVVARDASNIGFENLIHLAMESTPADARAADLPGGPAGTLRGAAIPLASCFVTTRMSWISGATGTSMLRRSNDAG